jgi:hypothetical protein
MPNTASYYPFLPKGSSLEGLGGTGASSFSSTQYGDVLAGTYPRTSSLSVEYYYQVTNYTSERKKIYALRNTLDYYKAVSPHYAYSSSLGDKADQAINLINIPSVFYGSAIDKGSIELSYYVSGTLLAKLQDINKNGELIQTTGTLGSGSVAGIVLYSEGIILLTGSWKLDNGFQEVLIYNPAPAIDYARWTNWGAGLNQLENQTLTASFDLNFDGVNYVNTLTMFAHAEKGDLNHSNNPTYIEYGQFDQFIIQTGSEKNGYKEYAEFSIKNTVKYPYENYTGSLEKQTYITKIGIYDENKNLIAIAKLAKPVRKTENRDFTFKLKLDI